MSARRYIVTSGLPYSNGPLHVGHIAGAYLPADTYVRYRRACGDDVRFVCGSDDNGVSALIAARKEDRPVAELTADYNARQREDFTRLGIDFDIFGGTHQPDYVDRHVELSQSFFRTIYDKGFFNKKVTEQLYDPEARQFLPDRYVKGRCYHVRDDGEPCGYPEAFGDQCESCGKAIEASRLGDPVSTITGARPELRETVHWYLELSRFAEPLGSWLEGKREPTDDGPAWRQWILNFTLGQIKEGLPERAMTRDLDWGVPVPLEDPDAVGKVLYVWFDAPIGYVSFTAALCEREGADPRDFERWWKDPDSRIVHFIGEDNTVFHALIWPAMLMAEGSYQLPWQVVANSFLNIRFSERIEKMSKSRGTALWISSYLERFDPDSLRYYLTAIAPENGRAAFDPEDFVVRNNGELLNALGNFVNRTLTFAQRYGDGRVPAVGERGEVDAEHLSLIGRTHDQVAEHLEAFRFKAALASLMALARASNQYLDRKQPWKQRKTDPAGCDTTVNVCVQTVRALMVMMAPFLPFSAERCAAMLEVEGDRRFDWRTATEELPAGHALGEPRILFRKLELEDLEGWV